MDFWFDFASSYAYIASCRVDGLAAEVGVPVTWRPFLLGPIFAAQGWSDSPFNLYPAKGAYMWRDMERLCQMHGLPLRRPSQFPRHSVLAARVALALDQSPAFGRAVFHANFAEDRDISSPAVLGSLLEELGQDAALVLERAQSPEIKLRLRQQTEEAQALGIFGAPSFVVGSELFWGNDRLDQALAWTA